MINLTKCEECVHEPVCKLTENYKQFVARQELTIFEEGQSQSLSCTFYMSKTGFGFGLR